MKALKKEASDFLSKKGRRIEFILLGLVVIFVTFFPLYIFSYFDYLIASLVDYMAAAKGFAEGLRNGLLLGSAIFSGVLAILAALFFTCPTYYCLFSYSYKSYREGIAGEAKFLSFGKYGYFGALRSGVILFAILCLCLAPVIALTEAGTYLSNSSDKRIADLVSYLFPLIIAAGLALGFLTFLLFRPLFLFGYYSARGKSVRESLSLSVKRMRTRRAKEIYKSYIKSFLPSLILSALTVLVLFVIDTLPKMMTVYCVIADDIVYGENKE